MLDSEISPKLCMNGLVMKPADVEMNGLSNHPAIQNACSRVLGMHMYTRPGVLGRDS